MTARHSARGIVIHAGQVLLIERWRDNQHYFAVPGGGVEKGETPEVAVVRELLEETGILVRPQKLLGTQRSPQAVHHYFLCEFLSGDLTLRPTKPEQPKAGNRYHPRWLTNAAFAALPPGEVHKFIQPTIAKLLEPKG